MKTLYIFLGILIISALQSCEKSEDDKTTGFEIAYTSNVNGGYGEVYTGFSDASGIKQISPSSNYDLKDTDIDPLWSPQGDRILYFGMRDNFNRKLFVYDFATNKEYKIAESSFGSIYNASWSPDGKKVVYDKTSMVTTETSITFSTLLYTNSWDGTQEIKLSLTNESCSEPQWHPNGTSIYAIRHATVIDQLIEIDALTGEILSINSRDEMKHLAISPDGEYFAFYDKSTGGIVRVKRDFSELKEISTDDGIYPSFSPDGKRIAYLAEYDKDTTKYAIHIGDAKDGRNKFNVSAILPAEEGYETSANFISWTPQNQILYGNLSLFIIEDDLSGKYTKVDGFYLFGFPQYRPKQ